MKEFVYKINKSESHEFEGEIVLTVPKYKERLKLLKQTNMKFNAKGEISSEVDQFDMAEKIAEIAEAHIKSIDLTRDGEKFISIDELEYEADYGVLISEVGSAILSGITMGKN